jgi:hypothetical protein
LYKPIVDRTVGTWRLIILHRHESHIPAQLDKHFKEQKILSYYLLSHLSHHTQPLDGGCHGPMKPYCGDEISEMRRRGSILIDKEDFLTAFKNALSALWAYGLVPLDTEVVIARLDVILRISTFLEFDPAV